MAGEPRLGHADLPAVVDRLALEVGQFDPVAVDDGEVADPRPGQRREHARADPAGADYCDSRGLQPLLPGAADLGQDDVPRITVELVVAENHWPVLPKPPWPRPVSHNSSTSSKAATVTVAGTSWAMRSPRRTAN